MKIKSDIFRGQPLHRSHSKSPSEHFVGFAFEVGNGLDSLVLGIIELRSSLNENLTTSPGDDGATFVQSLAVSANDRTVAVFPNTARTSAWVREPGAPCELSPSKAFGLTSCRFPVLDAGI